MSEQLHGTLAPGVRLNHNSQELVQGPSPCEQVTAATSQDHSPGGKGEGAGTVLPQKVERIPCRLHHNSFLHPSL